MTSYTSRCFTGSVIKLFNPDKDWIILPYSTGTIRRAPRVLKNIVFHRLLGVTLYLPNLLTILLFNRPNNTVNI